MIDALLCVVLENGLIVKYIHRDGIIVKNTIQSGGNHEKQFCILY